MATSPAFLIREGMISDLVQYLESRGAAVEVVNSGELLSPGGDFYRAWKATEPRGIHLFFFARSSADFPLSADEPILFELDTLDGSIGREALRGLPEFLVSIGAQRRS